jgi:hypothetical protein
LIAKQIPQIYLKVLFFVEKSSEGLLDIKERYSE